MSFTAELETHDREVIAAGRKGPINYECYLRAARRERAAARNAAFAGLGRWLRRLFSGVTAVGPATAGRV